MRSTSERMGLERTRIYKGTDSMKCGMGSEREKKEEQLVLR